MLAANQYHAKITLVANLDACVQCKVLSGGQQLEQRVELRAEANASTTLMHLREQVDASQTGGAASGHHISTEHTYSVQIHVVAMMIT